MAEYFQNYKRPDNPVKMRTFILPMLSFDLPGPPRLDLPKHLLVQLAYRRSGLPASPSMLRRYGDHFQNMRIMMDVIR